MRPRCLGSGASVLAAMAPEAATAGTPTPGNTESPQRNNLGIGDNTPGCGTSGRGKKPKRLPPAGSAGPYVPRCRRRNR